MAIAVLNRNAEIEFLKVNVMVNAIITASNGIRATIASLAGGGGETPSSDALNKSLDALKSAMLPHWDEESKKRSEQALKKLKREMEGGPLKVQVMAKPKKGGRK